MRIDLGVGVFRVLTKGVVLKDLTSELRDKEFGYFYDHVSALPIVDWEAAQSWLRS